MTEINEEIFAFVALLKACAKRKDLRRGITLHANICKKGLLQHSSYLVSSLIGMYAKCGALATAEETLEKIAFQSVASWNALIAGYAQQGQVCKALQCFKRMQKEGLSPDAVTFICILKVCGKTRAIKLGKEIHDDIAKKNLFGKYIVLGNALLDMYIKCGVLAKAYEVLEQLPVRDAVSWNVIIAGYAQEVCCNESLSCLEQMQIEGLSPDGVSFIHILKVCAVTGVADEGKLIHNEVVKRGLLENHVLLCTALVDMYSKCGLSADGEWVLKDIIELDIVSWNAFISGYSQSERPFEALNCFERLKVEGLLPDAVTFICILKVCSTSRAVAKGKQIHVKVIAAGLLKKNILLGTALVDMYAKCGMAKKAQNVLEVLPSRNIVSWNALITGYVQLGQGHEAFDCFELMKCEGLLPDIVTFICILKACATIGVIEKGETIHEEIVNRGLFKKDIVLSNALVDMYAKCGALKKAKDVLEGLSNRDVVSWNALIAGYVQQGQGHEVLNCYYQMLSDGLSPDAITFICIMKACAITGDIVEGIKIHEEIMNRGLLDDEDNLLANSLIDMYARSGLFMQAKQVHGSLQVRNLFSWSSLIAGYAQQGQGYEALASLERLQNEALYPDPIIFISALKACGSIGAVAGGKKIHNQIISMGWLEEDIVLGTSLVDMYSKCGVLAQSQQVLEQLPIRNVVAWSALISGYAQEGQGYQAMNCFEWMQSEGLYPNNVTFICVLKACGCAGDINKGKQIHDMIMSGRLLEKDVLLGSALVNMYARCGSLAEAQKVLEDLPSQDVISWNALIAGYSQHGQCKEALKCFEQMQGEGFLPDVVTFICILKACGSRRTFNKGKEIHGKIVSTGLLKKDIVLGNALVDMYARCGAHAKAQGVLEELPVKDVITWNSLIAGYAQEGKTLEAVNCFEQMQNEGLSPDPITYACILKACANRGAMDKGKQIHEEIMNRGILGKDVFLGNALVDMYVKCGVIAKAQEVLKDLPVQDVVSWSALIAAYAQQGQGNEAVSCFEHMKSAGLSPNAITFTCTLKACGSVGAIDIGKQIHDEIVRNGMLENDVMLGNALVDMYSKCGLVSKAQQVLEELPNRDLVSWNALIMGYAEQGQGCEALNCFKQMQSEGLSPDAITFLCVLTACCHAGLLQEAQLIFGDMTVKHGVTPTLEHHTCMVVVFGYAGYFDEATSVINRMPCLHYPEVWLALLAACKRWGNVVLGRLAFDQVVQLDYDCAGAYVLMADIFYTAGMQEDAEKVEIMRVEYATEDLKTNLPSPLVNLSSFGVPDIAEPHLDIIDQCIVGCPD